LNETEQFEKDIDDRRTIEGRAFSESTMQWTQFSEHRSHVLFVDFAYDCSIGFISHDYDGNLGVVASLLLDLFDDTTDFLERRQTVNT
jgi:hypothetical protein